MIPEHIDPDLLADNANKVIQEEVTRYFSTEELTEIINENDNQGNKKLMYAQKLAHELNLSFTLNCAIFVGINNVSKFKVDIEFDIRDKSIEFWLTSVEMKEIMDQAKELIIKEQLKPFIEKGVPCIQIG